jgi:hypothetical protein
MAAGERGSKRLDSCGEDRPTPQAPPPAAATREERWIQDIDYLATELTAAPPTAWWWTCATTAAATRRWTTT